MSYLMQNASGLAPSQFRLTTPFRPMVKDGALTRVHAEADQRPEDLEPARKNLQVQTK